MQVCKNHDLIGRVEVEDSVREAAHEIPADLALDLGGDLRMLANRIERLIERVEKALIEANAALTVPPKCSR